jgi:hypothetical protein
VSEQPGRYQRSAAGLVGAMIVLVGLIVAFVVVRNAVRVDPPSPVHAVDYTPQLEVARAQADFHVLAPTDVPPGWRITQAVFTPGAQAHWHLAGLTDRGRYVGLEQARRSGRSMVAEYVDPQPSRGQPVTVDGRRWTTWTDDQGDLALVRSSSGTTALVVGHDVPRDELLAYVAGLR